MTIRLTPDQEAIVERAVATGLAPSAEAFVSMALSHMQDELNFDLEARLGMDIDQLNAEIDKGLATLSRAREGAASFHSRMLKNQQDIASGRSQE